MYIVTVADFLGSSLFETQKQNIETDISDS